MAQPELEVEAVWVRARSGESQSRALKPHQAPRAAGDLAVPDSVESPLVSFVLCWAIKDKVKEGKPPGKISTGEERLTPMLTT